MRSRASDGSPFIASSVPNTGRTGNHAPLRFASPSVAVMSARSRIGPRRSPKRYEGPFLPRRTASVPEKVRGTVFCHSAPRADSRPAAIRQPKRGDDQREVEDRAAVGDVGEIVLDVLVDGVVAVRRDLPQAGDAGLEGQAPCRTRSAARCQPISLIRQIPGLGPAPAGYNRFTSRASSAEDRGGPIRAASFIDARCPGADEEHMQPTGARSHWSDRHGAVDCRRAQERPTQEDEI